MNSINFTPFPTLQTDRFILRKLNKSDARNIFEIRSDEEYSKLTGVKRYESVEEAEGYIARVEGMIDRNEAILWSIVMKGNNEYVGGICLWNISDDKTQAEIGYDLLPKHRGNGYIQEAIAAVSRYAFDVLKLDRIVAEEVRVENIKSIKVLERYGFQLEKTFQVQMDDGSIEQRANYCLLNNNSR
jgi:ribosomal-protein-alanine N-acetyltransferase